ncbi:hypothetical protein ACOMHN_033391 [Nucella lapillus]
MVCMDEILPKLYLGGITGIFDPALLREIGISHVLTLMDRALPGELMSGFTYHHVFALDLYDHDLLQDLEECLKFVEEGRQQGGVLVHCQAGASRSATVVIAYMMRTNSLSKVAALEFVRSRRSIVSPNDGFLQQLDLFELMGCKVNQTHEEFRRYMLSKMAVRSKSGFGDHSIPSSVYRPESSPEAATDVVYKCRKCRRVLFLSTALMPHMKGQGESAFDWRSKATSHQQKATSDLCEDGEGRRGGGGGGEEEEEEGERCEMSLFVEPMVWMKGQIETVEGKLACSKCKAKLGSFVWYGKRCPCGAWVAPAFHIQNSKVDAMKPRIAPPPNQSAAPAALLAPQPSANQSSVSPVSTAATTEAIVSGD